MNKGLYRQIFVWRRKNESEAIRYACLESVTTGLFYVQSAGFFRLPIDGEQARLHDVQFVELFIEASVADRANGTQRSQAQSLNTISISQARHVCFC